MGSQSDLTYPNARSSAIRTLNYSANFCRLVSPLNIGVKIQFQGENLTLA